MPCLPQHDLSFSRAQELAERRAKYNWDHAYLPPYPFLAMPNVKGGGLLNVADLLLGTYGELPESEQPPSSWVFEKVTTSMPVLYELLQRVPKSDWSALEGDIAQALKHRSEGWIESALEGLQALLDTDSEDGSMPSPDAVAQVLLDALVQASVELGIAVDENMSEKNEKPLKSLVSKFFSKDEPESREVGGETSRENAERVTGSDLDPMLQAMVIPLQAFLRFAAQMRVVETLNVENVDAPPAFTIELPPVDVVDPCTDDGEFVWRHVAGANPVLLQHADGALPAALGITDAHLSAALSVAGIPGAEAMTVEGALSAGRLFFVDFVILDDVPCQNGPPLDFFGQALSEDLTRQRYLPAPIALFYQADDALHVVGIQLGQDPEQHEVFTPAEDADLWRRVKALYRSANFTHHELCTHLGRSHLLMDAIAMTTARQLHSDHPIAALLGPHLNLHLWNDFIGRQFLYTSGGFIEQLLAPELEDGTKKILRRNHEQFDFWMFHLPRDLERRGVHDVSALPEYPYRDDGLLIWGAMHAYMTEYVSLYYSDAALAEDHELQAWLTELSDVNGGRFTGLPETFTSLDELIEALCAIIFNASGFHSAVNFTQYCYVGQPLSTPTSIFADPGKVRTTGLEKYLPDVEMARTQSLVTYILISMRGDSLMDLDIASFQDARVWPMLARFRQHLAGIESQIQARNEERERAYEFLLPSNVTLAANV